MVTYLVDAFNLFHAEPRLKELLSREGPGAACRALVQLLAAWLSVPRRRASVVVVMDGRRPLDAGRPGPGPAPGLTVVYMDDEADAELKRRLRQGRGRRVVVSADREITAVADAVGQEALAPRSFVRRVEDDLAAARERHERERTVPPEEVRAWLKAFGGVDRGATQGTPTPPATKTPPAAKTPPDAKSTPAARPPAAPKTPPAAKTPPPRPSPRGPASRTPEARRDGGPLSDDEVRYWKEFFDRPPG
ncbi:MAG: NYN domain-containing protein [Planctomycetes bacterium]|nr:NYN domain-containing protein [Planctomycetota bacterium]